MTAHDFGPRRMLIALDASDASSGALESAVELAARTGAELVGVFVEDASLVRLAMLPAARFIGYRSAAPVPMDSAVMDRELRALAQRARSELAAAAGRVHLRWSFRVLRGDVAPELLAAAGDVDVVTIGKVSHRTGRGPRLGSTARAILAGAQSSILVLEPGSRIGRPVVVLYDGSPESEKALAAAAHLAHADGGNLAVLLLGDSEDARARLRGKASAWLRARGLDARYRGIESADRATLLHALDAERARTFVLHVRTTRSEEALHGLVEVVRCPVLLVR